MRGENPVEQIDELLSICRVQPRQQFVLHDGGVLLQCGEMSAAIRGDGDDVATAVAWIRTAFDLVCGFETGHDAVDIVPIQAQDAPEIGLAELTLLHEAREHCEIRA